MRTLVSISVFIVTHNACYLNTFIISEIISYLL